MPQTLVGQTVRFSPKDKKDGGHKTRTLHINSEVYSDQCRYYQVTDTVSGETFHAIADKYDEYFLLKRSDIKPQNHREAIQNQSQIAYKK